MSELKPCPFCGSEPTASDEFDDEVLFYGCTKDIDCPMYDAPFVNLANWNTRPIEDALTARIAELEALVNVSEDLYGRIYEQAARIAELEGLVQQLVWVGYDLLADNTNPVAVTLFNGLVTKSRAEVQE